MMFFLVEKLADTIIDQLGAEMMITESLLRLRR